METRDDRRTRGGWRRRLGVVGVLALLAAMVAGLAPSLEAGAAAPTPGTGGPPRVVHFGSILPIVNETGLISLSQDATGTNDAAGSDVTIVKPAGATVRKAFMSTATVFSGGPLADGDITLDGSAVNFSVSTPNAINSFNYWAEVTSLVKTKIDAAPAGPVSLRFTEANTGVTDGEILSVIFDDPAQTHSNTIALLFGAQNVAGDTFNIGLADPLDKSDPNLGLQLGLGISYSFQAGGTQQYSTVDVNSQRISSAAGGEDDGISANGGLITVGGVGDSSANPTNPNATPNATDQARSDDELYDLLPFVSTGDTAIQVATRNPSNDDNIFYASLVLNSTTAVVGEGIVLGPIDATNPINTNHTVTATLQDDNGGAIANRAVTFSVISGPNTGVSSVVTSGADGKANFTYSSAVAGVDELRASFLNSGGETVLSNVVRKEWTTEDNQPPVIDSGPPKVAPVGTNVVLEGSASDPDGDPLTISWLLSAITGNVASCTFSNTATVSPTLNCTTVGVYLVQIRAFDGTTFLDDIGTTVEFVPATDRTPPACSLLTVSSSGITVKTSDKGSGLASVVATKWKNATVTVPAFTTGTTSDVIVSATKIKLGTSATVELKVTDVAGNVTVCDPVLAKVSVGAPRTFGGVPSAEHYLSVSDAAGITAVVVQVNGTTRVIWAPDGRTVDLGDVGDGTVSVRVLGPAGGSATVMIWDGKG